MAHHVGVVRNLPEITEKIIDIMNRNFLAIFQRKTFKIRIS